MVIPIDKDPVRDGASSSKTQGWNKMMAFLVPELVLNRQKLM